MRQRPACVRNAPHSAMSTIHDVVFLLDCDNTLLDNDHVQQDISTHLTATYGAQFRDRYWQIFETLRDELGYADYLGVVQQCRLAAPNDPRLLQLAAYFLDYPFATRLYPGALDVIAHLRRWGPTVILTDGDAVYQPRKVQRSGLWQAAEGRVLIYVHKEKMLDDIQRHYPARHYVVVDDKLRILTAMKAGLGDRLTTIFPRQGRYALDPRECAGLPPPDFTIEEIDALLNYEFSTLQAAAR